jgi:hypothetical protein
LPLSMKYLLFFDKHHLFCFKFLFMVKRSISIIAIIVAMLITGYFLFLMSGSAVSTGPFPLSWSIRQPTDDTSFGGVFYTPHLDDSLPHYLYKKYEDNINRIKQSKDLVNQSTMASGFSVGSLGVYELQDETGFPDNNEFKDPRYKSLSDSAIMFSGKAYSEQNDDSARYYREQSQELLYKANQRLNEVSQGQQEHRPRNYYLGLDGYTADNHTKFYIDKGIYKLAYVVWDSTVKRKYDSTMVGHYESRIIPVRYSANDKRILVPLSKTQYSSWSTGLEVLRFIFIFMTIYIFLGLPIQIIWNISRGRAFTRQNVSRFKLMGIAVAVYALVSLIMPYLLKMIFNIPADFQPDPFIQSLVGKIFTFFFAAALYLIGLAFQRGYNLQQEQNLTI